MAHFIGTVQGGRREVSRLGSAVSGLRTIAASWSGSVRVILYVEDGRDMARITLEPWHGSGGPSRIIYEGPIDGEARRAQP